MKISLRLHTALLICLLLMTITSSLQSAYIDKFPVEIKQPDGTVLNLFVSGDEFYNWLHDDIGYTIIQNP